MVRWFVSSKYFAVTYLRISNPSFLLQKIYSTHDNKPWITTGIKTSCQHKRELYLISRDSYNPKFKAHYKSHFLILSKVISKISKSNNKMKTTWDSIKIETCKNHTNEGIHLINIDGKLITINN